MNFGNVMVMVNLRSPPDPTIVTDSKNKRWITDISTRVGAPDNAPRPRLNPLHLARYVRAQAQSALTRPWRHAIEAGQTNPLHRPHTVTARPPAGNL